MDEFDIIKNVLAPLTGSAEGALALTDDAAFLRPGRDKDFVITQDSLVAGVHFMEDDPWDVIARKALRVNLSDLAAKGAIPRGYFLSCFWPQSVTEDDIRQFADGLRGDQTAFGIDLFGGDTVRTPGPASFTVTALGTMAQGHMVRRSGAQIGDIVWVTGTIGDAFCGLQYRLGQLEGQSDPLLLSRYRTPQPRTSIGVHLPKLATASIDLSDGLIADLEKLTIASGAAAEICLDDMPLSEPARLLMAQKSISRAQLATGGDDYEILFTAAEGRTKEISDLAAALDLQVTAIGTIKEGQGLTVMENGEPITIDQSLFHLFKAGLRHRAVRLMQSGFHLFQSIDEFLIGPAQGNVAGEGKAIITLRLRRFFRRFDRIPAGAHFRFCLKDMITKDMGMTAFHFVGNRGGHIIVIQIIPFDGIRHFIGAAIIWITQFGHEPFMNNLFDVSGKVAVVTGGSSGIGQMIATGLTANGVKTYISSRKDHQCQGVADELNAQGGEGRGECIPLPFDLSSMEGIEGLAAALAEREEKLDILVNNAGANWAAPIDEFPESGWDKVMDLNAKAVFFLTQKLLPQLRAAGDHEDPARVVNIASIDGMHGPDLETFAYSTSKAGVINLTRHLSKRLARDHITVNAICPGPFQSKMMAATIEAAGDALINSVPRRRLGSAEDAAGTVIFLASRAGAYITGAHLPLDGGIVNGL
ncbi:rhlG [Symbiodinium microadriaticum]|nr:rhlG [Symbiodinium microadriaticum]